jgi:hypothetical protein
MAVSDDNSILESAQAEGRDLLFFQTRAIDAVIHDLARPTQENVEVDEDDLVLVWMLQAIGVSIHSVFRLTEHQDMAIRDCFGIARSAAETAVNVAYIAVEGRPIAEQAIRHMRQKRWRDLNRQGRIGPLSITVRRELDATEADFDGLPEALAEFTNKKGGEVRDWTNLSIEQRIDRIHAHSPQASKLLGGAIFAIYRPSSELLHGTFYGINYFWQGSKDAPIRNKEAFDRLWVEEHFVTLLTALVFAASGAIEAVAATRNWPIHLEKQRELLPALERFADALSSSTGKN